MRVAEEHPFISYFIKLTFINSSDGKNVVLDVDSSMEVDRVKMQVVSHFQGSSDNLKKSLYYSLVSVKSSKVLTEKTRMCETGLSNGDEILLLPKRLDFPDVKDSFMKKKEESGPDLKAIQSATKHLETRNHDRAKPTERNQPDFSRHTDVLVTLIDLAHKLLCMNSETSKLFVETEKCLKEENEKPKEEPPKYDLSALQQLTEMGFPRQRAIIALLQNNSSLSDSIQWLFEHEASSTEDLERLSNPQGVTASKSVSEPADGKGVGAISSGGGANTHTDSVMGGANVSLVETVTNDRHSSQSDSSVGGAVGGASDIDSQPAERTLSEIGLKSVRAMEKLSTPEKVKSMLDAFKAFGRKGFKPDPKALQSLQEMGFQEVEIIEALRVNGNRKEQACEWLLGGREVTPAETQVTGCINEDSELFKALVEDPQVQVGLNSTKCLIALLTILENPSRMQQWVKEPEVGPLLQNAWKIFVAYMDKQGRPVRRAVASASS